MQSDFYIHLPEELINNNINSSPVDAARLCQEDSGDTDDSPLLAQNG